LRIPYYLVPVQQGLRILICPLDWGMGHATRCVPIVQELIALQVQPIIAGPQWMIAFYTGIFPSIEHVLLPGANIRYHSLLPAWLKIILLIPDFLLQIKNEKQHIASILLSKQIDGIISDNRYGCYHPTIPSCIISHQISPELPIYFAFARGMISKFLKNKIKHFQTLWIPDIPDFPGFAGKMSHPDSLPKGTSVVYIGLLSRLPQEEVVDYEADLAILCSGPEPQRSIFEQEAIQFAQMNKLSSIVLGGITNSLTSYDHKNISKVLQKCRLIICRSGYSTLMDLLHLKRKAILVATPGQPEQEYLAIHFRNHFQYEVIQQKRLSTLVWNKTLIPFDKEQNFESCFHMHKTAVRQFVKSVLSKKTKEASRNE